MPERKDGHHERQTRPAAARRSFRQFGPEPSNDPLVGMTIHGRYSILDKRGEGGMGAVYRAFDSASGTHVAVKVISEKLISGQMREEIVERFFREAAAARLIDHPNVVKTLDVGSFGDRLFQVMEYIEGEDLGKALKRQGRVTWEWLAPVMLELCDAVDAIHNAGLIHRDLKPANVLMAKNGRETPKIGDFGVVRFDSSMAEQLTVTGGMVGTFDYMPPEPNSGRDVPRNVDVYSLGMIMYRALAGRLPFHDIDNSAQALVLRSHRECPSPRAACPDIPEEVEEIIMRAIAMDPGRRFGTAAELKAAIVETLQKSGSGEIVRRHMMLPKPAPRRAETEPAQEEPQAPDHAAALKRYERRGSAFGKFMKWAVLTAAMVTASYFGYIHRHDIERAAGPVFRTVVEKLRPGSSPAGPGEVPKPEPEEAARQGYDVTVESVPPGANVWLEDGARTWLAQTPMQKALPPGSHRIRVTLRGYAPKTLIVSETSPSHRFELQRAARQRNRPSTIEITEDEMAPAPPGAGQDEAGGEQ